MGPPQRRGIQEKQQFGEMESLVGDRERFRCLTDSQGTARSPWAYRCGVQRKVLPGERFVISPQIGGDEAMSMDNIQWARVYSMRNEKRTSDEPGYHPHLEE